MGQDLLDRSGRRKARPNRHFLGSRPQVSHAPRLESPHIDLGLVEDLDGLMSGVACNVGHQFAYDCLVPFEDLKEHTVNIDQYAGDVARFISSSRIRENLLKGSGRHWLRALRRIHNLIGQGTLR